MFLTHAKYLDFNALIHDNDTFQTLSTAKKISLLTPHRMCLFEANIVGDLDSLQSYLQLFNKTYRLSVNKPLLLNVSYKLISCNCLQILFN